MNPKFLDLLCCPRTGEPLHLDSSRVSSSGSVVSGELISRSGRRYPIIRSVPRFVVEEAYASSFGYEWNRWACVQFDSENAGRSMAGHTTRMWEAVTKASEDKVRNKVVVEFGCGPGRFLDVVRRKGGVAVGLDLSLAVEAANRNFPDDPEVLIVQGDISNPPFRKGSVDGGYSIGVLHHTPDPQRGLSSLAQIVKPGGWVACVVYPKQGLYSFRSVERFRRISNTLRPMLGYYPSLIYAYFSAYVVSPLFTRGKRIQRMRALLRFLEEQWIVSLDYLPDVRWRVLDTFDAITPVIASTHTGEEVRGWMKVAGCSDIRTADWGETSVVGVKA